MRGGLNIYTLQDLLHEDIDGYFHEIELQGIQADLSGVYKISKIIPTRKRKGLAKEALVRWLHYGSRFDSWVPVSDLKRHINRTAQDRFTHFSPMEQSFYIFVCSKDSTREFPTNNNIDFTVLLPEHIHLEGKWSCALVDSNQEASNRLHVIFVVIWLLNLPVVLKNFQFSDGSMGRTLRLQEEETSTN